MVVDEMVVKLRLKIRACEEPGTLMKVGGVFRIWTSLKKIGNVPRPPFSSIYFIVLKSSMSIFRKSQKVSAFNFDPKGV